MEDFPTGPPPSYDTAQDKRSVYGVEKQNARDLLNESSSNPAFEDPPPYKEKESPTESISSFYFLFPVVMRPWKRFFSMCSRCRWSTSAENFGFNLSYYQINYALMMLSVVIVALWWIDSDDFNFCILWSSITVLLVYVLNTSGFAPRLLGRKLSLSEQLTAMVMFELPFYGLLPGAVPFIYFVAVFSGFVMVHACLTPVSKVALGNSEIQHI